MPTKLERAQMKRMRQAMFRATQYVNGELVKRLRTLNFDGKSAQQWYEEEMEKAAGPIYAALREIK